VPEEVKSSWADEVEDDGNFSLPEPTETIKDGTKIVIDYKIDENGKKVTKWKPVILLVTLIRDQGGNHNNSANKCTLVGGCIHFPTLWMRSASGP
jgi:hypothetical protein